MAAEQPKKDGALRLFALSGLVPLGVFLVVHVLVSASALGGGSTFDAVSGALSRSPLVTVIEVVLVLVPLAFHGVVGLVRVAKKAPPVREYPVYPARLLRLMRLTGVILFVFAALHFYELRWHRMTGAFDAAAVYTKLSADLSATWWGVPWIAIGYLVALAAGSFHLAAGAAAWRVDARAVTGLRAQRRVLTSAAVGGSALFLVGALTVIAVATGGQMFPEREPPPVGCGPDDPSNPPPPTSPNSLSPPSSSAR